MAAILSFTAASGMGSLGYMALHTDHHHVVGCRSGWVRCCCPGSALLAERGLAHVGIAGDAGTASRVTSSTVWIGRLSCLLTSSRDWWMLIGEVGELVAQREILVLALLLLVIRHQLSV